MVREDAEVSKAKVYRLGSDHAGEKARGFVVSGYHFVIGIIKYKKQKCKWSLVRRNALIPYECSVSSPQHIVPPYTSETL